MYEEEEKSSIANHRSSIINALMPEAGARLPPELLTRLEQAIDRLHTEMIHEVIEIIREHNDVLANELNALMYQFDYGTIVRWIRQTRESTHE